jgi:hypothetical protein
MIGYLVVEIEPAEPSVSEMQLDVLAKPPLGPDAVAVAYDQILIMSSIISLPRPRWQVPVADLNCSEFRGLLLPW